MACAGATMWAPMAMITRIAARARTKPARHGVIALEATRYSNNSPGASATGYKYTHMAGVRGCPRCRPPRPSVRLGGAPLPFRKMRAISATVWRETHVGVRCRSHPRQHEVGEGPAVSAFEESGNCRIEGLRQPALLGDDATFSGHASDQGKIRFCGPEDVAQLDFGGRSP